MTDKQKIKAINALIERTENNIDFYIKEEKNYHLLNEIGVLRGLIYAYEEITKEQYPFDDWELKIIELQETLRDIDNEIKKS